MGIEARIDNVTLVDGGYLSEVCPPPKSVKIEITANCNLKCRFCVKSIQPDEGHMDRKLYSRLIREIKAAGTNELGVFFVGESFVCKWLPEAIAEAKQVGFEYVFLTTNGTAATPARVKACMEAGLDSLKFSLNFDSREQFEEVAQVDGRLWKKQFENLKAARAIRDEHGYHCGIYASSIAFDGEQGERMQAIVDEIKSCVDSHYVLPLYGMSGASKAAGMKPQPGNPGRLDAMRAPLPCWSVFTEGHITKDGLLSACCFGNGASDALAMADLREVDFMAGWNSLKYQALRRAHLCGDVSRTACAECAAA